MTQHINMAHKGTSTKNVAKEIWVTENDQNDMDEKIESIEVMSEKPYYAIAHAGKVPAIIQTVVFIQVLTRPEKQDARTWSLMRRNIKRTKQMMMETSR